MLEAILALALSGQPESSLSQSSRLNSQDIYCAAIGVVLTEREQSVPTTPGAEQGLMTLTLYFLGRVEGSLPGQDGATAVLDMASVMNANEIAPADITACGTFMGAQVQNLLRQSGERGRALH